MQFQLVHFQAFEDSEKRLGLAKIAADDSFNGGSVDYIIDCETGVKLQDCWTFDWTSLPFDKITTGESQ